MTSLMHKIAAEVAGEFGSTAPAILAPTRGKPEDARARAIAMYIYSKAEAATCGEPCLSSVGRAFGRDRTTVRHAYARVRDWLSREPGFRKRLDDVSQRVAAIGYPGGVL